MLMHRKSALRFILLITLVITYYIIRTMVLGNMENVQLEVGSGYSEYWCHSQPVRGVAASCVIS